MKILWGENFGFGLKIEKKKKKLWEIYMGKQGKENANQSTKFTSNIFNFLLVVFIKKKKKKRKTSKLLHKRIVIQCYV